MADNSLCQAVLQVNLLDYEKLIANYFFAFLRLMLFFFLTKIKKKNIAHPTTALRVNNRATLFFDKEYWIQLFIYSFKVGYQRIYL